MRTKTVIAVAGAVAICGAWVLLRRDLLPAPDRLRLSELGDPLCSGVTIEADLSRMPRLSDTAPAWRVLRQGMSKAQAATLAAKCGIRAPVRESDSAAWRLVAVEGDLALQINKEPGCLRFADLSRWGVPPKGPANLPDERHAAEVARRFLEGLRLFPEGDVFVGAGGPSHVRTRGAAEGGTTEVIGFAVPFGRRLSGVAVTGYGGLTVELAADGKPAGLYQVWRPVEEDGSVRLIGVAGALRALKEGHAGCRWLDRPGAAHVESVRLVYWERRAEKRQMFFEPVYEFRGTFKPDNGSPEEAFKAYVPAVAGSGSGGSKGE
jgi:hypothetical protein